MGGLSLKLAVSSTLALAQAEVQEISQGQASTTPDYVTPVATNNTLLNPSQLEMNIPMFCSTRSNESTPTV
ncbi:hypothetical protein DAPPUDRAFT_248728 [Daphnia pulex]|uniref:Uncharacterized protein n=1 Tax=Daphnia pulex TaxID=6669 RepID=E9GV36_DAPPU|nr:hypothetical protein DAPPUDRAFT_248728 [Daphnia pulex]|eukprot:EFX76682.1 hypothetical protein DAPPUDRAFT_248728 [Daphnia pulex]